MNVNGHRDLTADADSDPVPLLQEILPPRRTIPVEHRQRYNQVVAAEQAVAFAPFLALLKSEKVFRWRLPAM